MLEKLQKFCPIKGHHRGSRARFPAIWGNLSVNNNSCAMPHLADSCGPGHAGYENENCPKNDKTRESRARSPAPLGEFVRKRHLLAYPASTRILAASAVALVRAISAAQ